MSASVLEEKQTIAPTHHCFDDALDFVTDVLRGRPREAAQENFVVVHAVCVSPSGEEYAHAWVEHGGNAIWSGILRDRRCYFETPRNEFYASLRVKETTRYTVRDVWRENQRSGHYGPWLDRYRALCGSDRRILGVIKS